MPNIMSQKCTLTKGKFMTSSLVIWLQLFFILFSSFTYAAQQNTATELEKVTLQLKWKHDFQFAGYYAAKAQGFYRDEGIELNFQEAAADIYPIEQVTSGQAQYAVGDIGIIAHYANGKDIRALAAIYQHNPLIFISKQSSGIISPYEMAGKRLMFDNKGGDNSVLTAMLTEAGLTHNRYTVVARSFSTAELEAGQVDAMSAYITDQPFTLKQKNIAINIIKPENYGIDFYGDILFTSTQEIQQHPQRVEGFKRASLKGWQYAMDHQEEIIQLIRQHYAPQLSIEHLRYEAQETRKLILPDTIPIGQININRLRRIADTYTHLQQTKKLTDAELKTFIAHSSELNLSTQEKAWLKQHPVIRLGIDRHFPPYEWLDEQNNYQGIAADFLHLIEQRVGIHFEIMSYKNAWSEVLEDTQTGKIDMISCLVKTKNRARQLNFSPAYINSSTVIIAEQSQGYINSLNQLAGHSVAIHKGHYTQELLAKYHPEIHIISTDTLEQALNLVATGKATAFVGDATAASYIIKESAILNLSFAGSTPYQSNFSLATSKRHPELHSIMQKALASISEQERGKIFNRWQKLKVTKGLSYTTVFKYSLLVLVIFLIFAYWIYLLKKSEKARKDSETKLYAIFDNAPMGIWLTDKAGHFTFVNQTYCNATGLTQKQLLDPNNLPALIGQSKLDKCLTSNQACLNQDEPYVLHETLTLKNGKRHELEVTKTKLLDSSGEAIGIIGILVDITERKQTEIKLKQSEAHFRFIAESAQALIWMCDTHMQYIWFNKMWLDFTGRTLEQELEHNWATSVHPDDLQACKNCFANHFKLRQPFSMEYRLKHHDGTYHWILDNGTPRFTPAGKFEGYIGSSFDITERKKDEEIIWQQANYDELTHLPNRRMFQDRLELEIVKSHREKLSLALLFIDLDHFKAVNDTLGHEMGDLLLIKAAQRIMSCVRESDTVARLGGDEFTVILSELSDISSIERITDSIIKNLSQPFRLEEQEVYITASIGITLYPNDGDSVSQLLKNADQAMYRAKNIGRNRFSYYTPAMQETAQKHLQILTDLRSALTEQQFQLHYQPIIDLETGKILKAEALIRWHHPVRGIISPADFIPIAEESGLIIEIGDWVFKQAAQQAKQWQEKYGLTIQISINKSPIQFHSTEDSTNWIKYLKNLNLLGENIVIEITESLLMETSDSVIKQLLQFRDANIQVSMDDFGTGYSSLAYLNKFDIDYLKIDRSFTRNLSSNSSDMILSEAIIVMAHKLGLKVIAEGIETEEQYQLLKAAGCDYGQGYLFSRPVAADEFIKLIN
ncbi:MAG: EAL domain-containing protein [Methyloprofundus sp.]|nr:EAL domain-containing protein [Methyloprofundus sp.]